MKKACLAVAVILILAAVAVAGVDFSGTWAFNESKSDPAPARAGGPGGGPGGGAGGGQGGGMGRGGGMGGGELTIKQTGNVMTVIRTVMGNPMETPYTMDGAEHTNTTQFGDMKYKAVLTGNSLHVTGTQTTPMGERAIDQTYELSADGKTLTMTSVNQGPSGPTTRKTVYDKK